MLTSGSESPFEWVGAAGGGRVSSAPLVEKKPNSERLKKPMASVHKVSLFRREIREWISPPAFEILIGAAEVITEGAFDTTEADKPVYLGSIQVKVPLSSCAAHIRDPLDAAAARQLTTMLREDVVAREVLLELAQREAQQAAGCALFDLQVELDTSHDGEWLQISMDVEGLVRPT